MKDFQILEKVNSEYILVRGKYGDHRVKFSHFNNGVIPTIQTAIDKNLYFINQAKEIHGNRYDYTQMNYINASSKIEVVCSKHGTFSVKPNQHLSKKSGCPECGKLLRGSKRRSTTEKFIAESAKNHGNYYDYSKVNYIKQSIPVIIICPIHGEFMQKPKDHIKGCGCYECGKNKISESRGANPTGWEYHRWVDVGMKSKRFDAFKMYIINCYNNEENFIKIGKTYQKVDKRFRTLDMMPYNYGIIEEVVGDGEYICNLERTFKNKCKEFAYIPKKSFNGRYECFDAKCLEVISAIPR